MATTNWKKAPLNNYSFHKEAENESGYNYYLYIHSATGQVLVMRETIATGDMLFADGGYNLQTAYTNRATLTYKIKSLL